VNRRALQPPQALLFVFTFLLFPLLLEATGLTLPTPPWVWEFQTAAQRILALGGESEESFNPYQQNLTVFEKTGEGACITWSKLMAKIAFKHQVYFKTYVVGIAGKNIYTEEALPHQITLLWEKRGQKWILWLQSNDLLTRVRNRNEALSTLSSIMTRANGRPFAFAYQVLITPENLYK
jgi:hypothetical protein